MGLFVQGFRVEVIRGLRFQLSGGFLDPSRYRVYSRVSGLMFGSAVLPKASHSQAHASLCWGSR